jgi:hypothetical protein
MVVASLSLGGLVGIVLSGGFVYWEVGRFAAPQVPVSLFDERRELFAYTAGLFVGVPLAVVYLLFAAAFSNGAIPGALLFLAFLVGGSETAQIFFLRTKYWGDGDGRPFYVLGFRAAIGGILALAIVASYLSGPSLTWLGLAVALLDALAVVGLQVAVALLSLRTPATAGSPAGGPLAGVLLGAIGFFLLGLGSVAGEYGGIGAALVTLLGANFAYTRRRAILKDVRPPRPAPRSVGPEGAGPYGRTGSGASEPLPRGPGP